MKAAIAYRGFFVCRNELCLLLKFDTVARCFALRIRLRTTMQEPACNAYLDNAATTPVIDEAIEAMNDVLRHAWAIHLRLDRVGYAAKEALEQSRATIAECLASTPTRSSLPPVRPRPITSPCAGLAWRVRANRAAL